MVSWWLTGILIKHLQSKNIVDLPNERSMHQGSIPRGGGLVIVGLLITTFIALAWLTNRYQLFIALALTVSAWSLLSWLDDCNNLSPKFRLAIQSLLAIFMIIAFGHITTVQISESISIIIPGLGLAATFFGIIWFANLYNFMDGMDGLAASQTIIAASTMTVWFWQYGDQGLAISCLVLASSTYGFLLLNWHPAKIFLGDVGSVTIGAFFTILMIWAVTRYDFPILSFVILFAVFVADATITVLQRLIKREKVWLPHQQHYYQRLAKLGFAHNKIVIAQIVLMLICSIIASITIAERDRIIIGGLIAMGVILIALISTVIIEKKVQENNQ